VHYLYPFAIVLGDSALSHQDIMTTTRQIGCARYPLSIQFTPRNTSTDSSLAGGNLISARPTDLQDRYAFVSIKWPK
jgi:hypothetical protein